MVLTAHEPIIIDCKVWSLHCWPWWRCKTALASCKCVVCSSAFRKLPKKKKKKKKKLHHLLIYKFYFIFIIYYIYLNIYSQIRLGRLRPSDYKLGWLRPSDYKCKDQLRYYKCLPSNYNTKGCKEREVVFSRTKLASEWSLSFLI